MGFEHVAALFPQSQRQIVCLAVAEVTSVASTAQTPGLCCGPAVKAAQIQMWTRLLLRLAA